MSEPHRENQRNQQNLNNFNHFTNNDNILRNNDLQWNINPPMINNSNLYMHDDESTSQVIDLSVKGDNNIITDGKQKINNKTENFNMQYKSEVIVNNNAMMAGSKRTHEQMYQVEDVSKPIARKGEVCEVPQKKHETVSYDTSNFELSEMNNAAINRYNKNVNTQTFGQSRVSSDNLNIGRMANPPHIKKTRLLHDQEFQLLHRPQTEALKYTKDMYTQTDKNNNHKCSQTETSDEVAQKQLNSYMNQHRVKNETMVQNPTQEIVSINQEAFLQEGNNTGDVATGQEAVTNAEPAMTQAGLCYLCPSPADNYTSRAALAHHLYVTQEFNSIWSQNGANIYQPNVQYPPQYSQYPATRNLECDMANITNNYQNYYNYQNMYSKF